MAFKYNRYMDYKQAISLLETEKECITRNELKMCNRDCSKCELVQDTYKLLDAYNMAIELMKKEIEDI